MPDRFSRYVLVGLFLYAPVRAVAPQEDLGRELEAAKNVYETGNFPRASSALSAVIAKLEERTDLEDQQEMLVDAHFHLGLTYFALNDSTSARESFEVVASLEPDYRIDPERYAPRVVELFEQAREAAVARRVEPESPPQPTAEAADIPADAPPVGDDGTGSRTPLLIAGVGGGAAAGIALGLAGGGGDDAGAGAQVVDRGGAGTEMFSGMAPPNANFTVHASASGTLSVRLTYPNTEADLELEVWRGSCPLPGSFNGCEKLASSYEGPGIPEEISVPVQAGDHTIAVMHCCGEASTYTLVVMHP